jgi:beta-glucanase (GH16 family)
MKIILSFLILIISAVVLINCSSSDPEAAVTPSNLTLETNVSTDGSGLITVAANANDAVKYAFTFGEDLTATPLISTTGEAQHNYINSGTYNVRVVAYSADDLFIDKKVSISVEVDEPAVSDVGYKTPDNYAGMTLVWQDEFSGAQLNSSYWTHETGNNNGWGNGELQNYQPQNTIVQDGYLTIKANKEGSSYTSSRLISKDKKQFKYGRIDIRAKLPKGQGIWPALWMLGSNISTVNWPKCGEIDIMEMIGGTPEREKTAFGTLHWDNAGTKVCTCDKPGHVLTEGSLNDRFHVFTLKWDAQFITWYVDDVQFNKIDITPGELDEFQKEFFFIFNVAVGGAWPGNPDASTVFPQRMIVDYIRVFQ